MHIDQCRTIELPGVNDPRGNLTFVEEARHIPFNIARVYYLADVPDGARRGGHAHRQLHQFLIAISGSFDVVLNDGLQNVRIHMDHSGYGLYICPMVWREMDNFSSGAVCLALASAYFDEADYFRDYDDYLDAINRMRTP